MNDEIRYIEQPHSVEVSINAKGLWSGNVKCYACTPEVAMKRALDKAIELDRIINEKNNR